MFQQQLTPELVSLISTHIAVTSETTKRALDEVAVGREAAQRAQAQFGATFGALKTAGAIGEGRDEEAKRLMSSHEGSLVILKIAADRIGALKQENADLRAKLAAQLGGPDSGPGDAQPSGGQADSYEDPLIVGSRTTQKRASDLALLKVLDPAPSR